jgi:glycosyltransferase involved in cell wall biosynthesis
MKILQVTVHFSPNVGGVETHLDDLVSGLRRDGNEVSVLTYRPLVSGEKWKMVESTGKNLIFRIPWIKGYFYKFNSNPILEFLYLVHGLFIFLPLMIIIKRPECIHAHGLIAGFVSVFWGKLFEKRVVISTHNLYEFPTSGMFRNFAKAIFFLSDHVLTLSKQSKSEIEKLGINKNKITVFTYWVDLELFKPLSTKSRISIRKKLNWDKKFIVLFVGRLIEEKGIEVLLESLKSWNKNIVLAIAGSGPMEKEIQNSKLKTQNLTFLGKLDQNDLPSYYSAADILIVPSIHEEGFGRVIIESLACGTPVIGANRGAIPEAMDESVGRLIEVSPKNIKTEVEKLYLDKQIMKKLSLNARKFAEKRYDLVNNKTIFNSYNE